MSIVNLSLNSPNNPYPILFLIEKQILLELSNFELSRPFYRTVGMW
jgi:hypothetical protein